MLGSHRPASATGMRSLVNSAPLTSGYPVSASLRRNRSGCPIRGRITLSEDSRLAQMCVRVSDRSSVSRVGKPLAEPTGLEPATSAVTGRRSNQLSYGSL